MKENKAYFAGGCFWCTEHDLKSVEGVLEGYSGYIGEEKDFSPSYERHTGFREGVKIIYDEEKITFKKLCQFFLDHIDPTDSGGQFYDRGESYKTAIYFQNEAEKEVVNDLLKELGESKVYDKKIAVETLPFPKFYMAEEYHQNYASKNPKHYEKYRHGSGRADFIAKTCMIRNQKKIQWRD